MKWPLSARSLPHPHLTHTHLLHTHVHAPSPINALFFLLTAPATAASLLQLHSDAKLATYTNDV